MPRSRKPATKLKPCPFCGAHASVIEEPSMQHDGVWFHVECWRVGCQAHGPDIADDKQAAIDGWNKRVKR